MATNAQRELNIQRLVELDLQKTQLKAICAELHISPPTIYVYREDPLYAQFMDKALKATSRESIKRIKKTVGEVRAELSGYAQEAIDTLVGIMRDVEARPAVRITAACEIIDRDGQFAKVSRLMNVQPGEDGRPILPEDTAAEILKALEKSPSKSVN